MRPRARCAARTAAWMLVAGLGGALAAAAAPQTRAFRQAFPPQATELRLANLAGRIELVRGDGPGVVADATVRAEAESAGATKKLLDGMRWVRSQDSKGRDEWALSYPVDEIRSYHYPGAPRAQPSRIWSFFEGLSHTSTTYRGERVRVYGERSSSVPTLYVDLRIALPAGSNVVVRNVVGPVESGGPLAGTLTVDTGSGDVRLASYSGHLTVDTGSGKVLLGEVKGETSVDTGSGDVQIRRLVGNSSFDTGSGDVTLENVSAGKLALDTGSGDVTVRTGDVAKLIADTGSGSVKVLDVEVEELMADTGSGDVVLRSSLAKATKIIAETGSGDVRIEAGPAAAFNLDADQGSGDLEVRYADAVLRKSGRKVVGAKRGDGRTAIHIETGSGDCVIRPVG